MANSSVSAAGRKIKKPKIFVKKSTYYEIDWLKCQEIKSTIINCRSMIKIFNSYRIKNFGEGTECPILPIKRSFLPMDHFADFLTLLGQHYVLVLVGCMERDAAAPPEYAKNLFG